MPARIRQLFVLLPLLVTIATADQYWVAYEGNDFPENEGWNRQMVHGGALRSIADGVLTLDGRESVLIADAYEMSRPIDPEPGETFVMEWRLRVDEVSAREDPTIVVFSDDGWAVGFEFSQSYLLSGFEPTTRIEFSPGDWHTFSLRSADLRGYELSLDGKLVLEGNWVQVITTSTVGWGDAVQGTASLSHWDYLRFGVVPEPSTHLGVFILFLPYVVACLRRQKLTTLKGANVVDGWRLPDFAAFERGGAGWEGCSAKVHGSQKSDGLPGEFLPSSSVSKARHILIRNISHDCY